MTADSKGLPLPGDGVRLSLPGVSGYLEVVTAAAEEMARLAGFGPRAAGRTRLIAEEVFMHIAELGSQAGLRDECRVKLVLTVDGLTMSFLTNWLSYDPAEEFHYSLKEALEGEAPRNLGLYLVKNYAQAITLTKRGPQRELTISLTQREEDTSSRPWSRLVPRLRDGLSIRPYEHEGRLVYRLDDAASGKSYLMRPLAQQVIGLIDGQRSFASIMAHTLKVMPEVKWSQVEDLFEVLIEKGLVHIKELPRKQARVEVRQEEPARMKKGLEAYRKLSD